MSTTLWSASATCKSTSITVECCPTSLGAKSAVGQTYIAIIDSGTAAGDPVRTVSAANSSFGRAATTTGYSANVWHVASGSNASATDRSAFINGGDKGTNTTNEAPVINEASSEIVVGATERGDSTLINFFPGDLCEVAWFLDALSDRQQAALGARACPLLVSFSVAGYWPLWPGNTGTEPGLIRGTALTATGTTSARHGPVFARHSGGL